MTSRRGILRRVHDESGAVAIIVALSLSTLLIGFGSLAIDLGNLYVRNTDMRTAADLAAVAGAGKLPDVASAQQTALDTLCNAANRVAGWPSDMCDPSNVWYKNGDPADGEISFYKEKPAGQPTYQPTDAWTSATPASEPAVAIRVVPPPATVHFGLAAAMGFASANATAAATARIGTPAGYGVLPFAAEGQDLTAQGHNQLCVQDPAVAALQPSRYPGEKPTGRAPSLTSAVAPGRTITIGLTANIFAGQILPGRAVTVTLDDPAGTPLINLAGTFNALAFGPTVTATLPRGLNGTYGVWVSGTGRDPLAGFRNTAFISNYGTVAIGPASTAFDPCAQNSEFHGVLASARDQGGPVLNLTQDTKASLQPTVHAVQDFPTPGVGPLLNAVVGVIPGVEPLVQWTVDCTVLGAVLTGLLGRNDIIKSSLLAGYNQDINCSDVIRRGFGGDLTTGLTDNNDGRLTLQCPDSSATTSAPAGTTLDNTDLFSSGANTLVKAAGGGGALRTAIESGTDTPTNGEITDVAFRCGRLGLVPIMNPGPDTALNSGRNGITNDAPVVGYTYAWIDANHTSELNGVEWGTGPTGVSVRKVRAHIIDPAYFNQLVTGSPVVLPWLGTSLPKQVVLVRDVGDPPA